MDDKQAVGVGGRDEDGRADVNGHLEDYFPCRPALRF